MIRRFLATLVIGVMLGASVAGTVCQTTCATRDAAQAQNRPNGHEKVDQAHDNASRGHR